MVNIKDVPCKPRQHDVVAKAHGRPCDPYCHVDLEQRVARFSFLYMHASVPIMVLRFEALRGAERGPSSSGTPLLIKLKGDFNFQTETLYCLNKRTSNVNFVV